jgi:hypothetical protein
VTDQIVHARIRNRLIEVLGWIVDSRANVPDCGFDELINLWTDWAPLHDQDMPREIYTSAEISGVRSVREAIERFCLATLSSVPNTIETTRLAEWVMVTEVARRSLEEMSKRGTLAEEENLNV